MAYVPPHLRNGGQGTSGASAQRSLSEIADGMSQLAVRPAWAKRAAMGRQCLCGGSARTLFPGRPHTEALRRGSQESALLGGIPDFCAAFFHVEACPEAGIPDPVCLCGEGSQAECPRKSVACVARLRRGGGEAPPAALDEDDVYVGRYSNCQRGGSEVNVHAEQFAMEDAALLAAIRELQYPGPGPAPVDPAPAGRLWLYLSYQPCHHSSGTDPDRAHLTPSCTRALLRFLQGHLAPGVALSVVAHFVYRAHWAVFEDEAQRRRMEPAVRMAREGLALLRNGGVGVCAPREEDWAFLRSLCEPSVEAAWRAGSPPFAEVRVDLRRRMDAFVGTVLAEHAHEEGEGEEERGGQMTVTEERRSPPGTSV